MDIKKQILAVAAVGALTAATAVPAMALENEFHGMYRLRGIVSNFDDGAAGAADLSGSSAKVDSTGKAIKDGKPVTNTYIEQRMRLMYVAKANDNLKLVSHFEFDSRWGDTSYNQNATNASNSGSATRNQGGGIGADQTNLETKNVYLDFNVPSTPLNIKLGIQGFSDAYKGIIFNNDAAGMVATAKLTNATVNFGYFRFDDATTGSAPQIGVTATSPVTNTTTLTNAYDTVPAATSATNSLLKGNNQMGNLTRDFFTLGGKYNVTKDLSFGADYYLLYSDILKNSATPKTFINMIGVNAAANVGPASINGFFIYQAGRMGGDPVNSAALNLPTAQKVSAFAANLAAKMPIGPGTAKVTTLYISGDKNVSPGGGTRTDFQTIMERGNTTSGHTFYEANSMILLRNATTTAGTDRAVVYDLNNVGKGFIGAFLGYDLPMGKAFANSVVGIGAVANDNGIAQNGMNASSGTGSSNILGTEINTEVGYKLYDNLTVSVQAAYLILGDFYKNMVKTNVTPDNPYLTRLHVSYAF